MSAPATREFEIFERGYVRDLILDHFRSGLRNRTNPETGQLFSDDEIASATAAGTRWYRQAQAIDDYAQGEQRRALYLNDQLRINRANTQWLEGFHARQWDPEGRLQATPASGQVRVTGLDGTTIVASTTVPDETAYWGTTPQGVRVQAFLAETPIGNTDGVGTPGSTVITMIAVDPGSTTNLEIGDKIVWANRDPNMDPQAEVYGADWTGGTDVETDADWASRMEGNQRHRQGAGNDAQQRAWARQASNAIEDAFVYPCAFGNGSVEVCILQKRGASNSRLARIPSDATLQAAIARLTPPGSPVEPSPPHVIVVRPWVVYAHFGLRLSMLLGSDSGWHDARPFPNMGSSVSTSPYLVSVGASSVVIYSESDATLPSQAALATITSGFPRMMAWVEATSEWREFPTNEIASIEQTTTTGFLVTFTGTRPSWLVAEMVISPFTKLGPAIASAVIGYMDERGPGELFDETDVRFARSSRFPSQREEKPFRVGADCATRVLEALSGAAGDADNPYRATTDTTAPNVLAPRMHFLGRVGVYPLT